MRFGEAFRRSAAAFAVVLSFAAVTPAAPQDPDGAKILSGLAEVIRRGGLGGPVEELAGREDFAEMVKAHPAEFHQVCAAADERRVGLTVIDAEKARALTGRLVELGTMCLETNPEDADAMWSLALARLVRGRTERDLKEKPDPADWSEAATLLEKAAAKRPEGGSPTAEAARALLEGARLPGADPAAFSKRADDLLAKASTEYPDAGPILRIWAARVADRAAGLLPAKKADAVTLVESAIKRLAPAAQKPGPDLDVATAYNALVAFLLDRKLPTKAEFVTEASRCGLLEAKVPVSRCFSVDADDGSIHQLTADLEPLRTLTFKSYNWDTEYDFGVGDEPGGDNAKGLATADYQSELPDFTQITSKKEVTKGRLNPRIGGAYMWEIVGTRKDAKKPQRTRAWLFKSEKGGQVTFCVTMYEWDLAEMDAAGKSVLDSLTEIGK